MENSAAREQSVPGSFERQAVAGQAARLVAAAGKLAGVVAVAESWQVVAENRLTEAVQFVFGLATAVW